MKFKNKQELLENINRENLKFDIETFNEILKQVIKYNIFFIKLNLVKVETQYYIFDNKCVYRYYLNKEDNICLFLNRIFIDSDDDLYLIKSWVRQYPEFCFLHQVFLIQNEI